MREIWHALKECIIRFLEARNVEWIDEEVEFLKMQLDRERAEKNKLLNFILELNHPQEESLTLTDYKPLSNHVPWATRKQQLEQNARLTKVATEDLEKELLK